MITNKENKRIPLKFRLIKRTNYGGKLWGLNFMSEMKAVKVAVGNLGFWMHYPT